MHYSERKSRRVLDRFRWLSEGWYRRLLPVFIVFVLVFVVYTVATEPGNPWTPRLVGFFLLLLCNAVLLYLRPDLRFDLYRRYWPIKLHPLARAEADLLYRQLRQLAFSMGAPRAEQQDGVPGTRAEPGEVQ